VYADASKLKLPEVDGVRPLSYFLQAVKDVEPVYAQVMDVTEVSIRFN
jgi:hypothetical protein